MRTVKELYDLINKQYQAREVFPHLPAIKVNCYNALEVRAIRKAILELDPQLGFTGPDCFMVGDSLLTTHLGKESTKLESIEEQESFLNVMCEHIQEVRQSVEECFDSPDRPYVMGDLPDGTTTNLSTLLKSANQMLEAGAEVIKLEISNQDDLANLAYMVDAGIATAAHLGYVPQKNKNQRYGKNLDEAQSLISMARSAKELGACCLILERVSETVNEVLSLRNDQGLPIYSIFSGKAHGGGQNLNVWDSVYIPDFKAYFFPPTSKFDVNTYPATYTEESIKTCFKELLELTFTGQFPKSPPEPLNSEEILKIMSQSPWSPTVKCEKNPLEMMSMG